LGKNLKSYPLVWFVGADLAALCTEAALLKCIREEMDVIDSEDESIKGDVPYSMNVTHEHFTLLLEQETHKLFLKLLLKCLMSARRTLEALRMLSENFKRLFSILWST
ncbi:hypothetical protein CIPAW_02G056700, partial [Carya illinoinensis]